MMKKYVYMLVTATALTTGFTSCGGAEEENTETVAVTPNQFEYPQLKERTGELAKTEEWTKTKQKVQELMGKIQKDPADSKSILQLVQVYMQEARVTGEHPYYYPSILKILDHLLAREPNSFEGLTFKASVLMSQHRFKEAYETGTRAKKIQASNAYIYGVLTDANVELGNYEQAVAMSDSMQLLKPSLEAYARVSYLREIYGDYKGSIEAMKLAVEAGLPGSEPYCWCRKTLGQLFENTGQYKNAENEYLNILASRPDYAFAMEGLARIEKHNKNYAKANEQLNKAIAIMPEFSFHEELAEIMVLEGKAAEAQNKYKEITGMLKEDEASGHIVNLDIANVYIAQQQYDSALVFAEKEYSVRPNNIDVNAVLGWIYYKQGNNEKALSHIRKAKRTGCNHPLLNARAGIIETKAGGDAAAGKKYLKMAKDVNPELVILKEEVVG